MRGECSWEQQSLLNIWIHQVNETENNWSLRWKVRKAYGFDKNKQPNNASRLFSLYILYLISKTTSIALWKIWNLMNSGYWYKHFVHARNCAHSYYRRYGNGYRFKIIRATVLEIILMLQKCKIMQIQCMEVMLPLLQSWERNRKCFKCHEPWTPAHNKSTQVH